MNVNGGGTTMHIKMEIDDTENENISNEEYLVLRAKNALKYDPYEAKAWMLTAQTLFPHNFGVQVVKIFFNFVKYSRPKATPYLKICC